jgi:6-phospho-beta-glucosidase
MQREIVGKMRVPASSVSLDYFGLNHFGFVHGVQIDGREALGEVMAAQPSFMPDCNRHFSTLLNVSWSFVFENDRLVERQSGKANRAATLLNIEEQCDELLAAKKKAPEAYLEVLAQRHCDWYDLAVSPVLGQLTGAGPQQVFVNCEAGDALGIGCDRSVIEASCTMGPEDFTFDTLPDHVTAMPEYLLVRSMKQAELTLLDGITGGRPDRVMEACLINPMIRSLDRSTEYFDALRRTDQGIARFWENAA